MNKLTFKIINHPHYIHTVIWFQNSGFLWIPLRSSKYTIDKLRNNYTNYSNTVEAYKFKLADRIMKRLER